VWREEGCRPEGMQRVWREEGCRPEGMQRVWREEGCRPEGMQRVWREEGCRPEGMQRVWREEGCRPLLPCAPFNIVLYDIYIFKLLSGLPPASALRAARYSTT
jgi:hypothetical protein